MSQPLSDAALDQLFRTARTPNAYLDKPVSHEQMDAIWELTKMGPMQSLPDPLRQALIAKALEKYNRGEVDEQTFLAGMKGYPR